MEVPSYFIMRHISKEEWWCYTLLIAFSEKNALLPKQTSKWLNSLYSVSVSAQNNKLEYKNARAAFHKLLCCIFHLAPVESWWFGMFWSECVYMNRIKIHIAILGCEVVWWKLLQRPKEHVPVCMELFVGFARPEAPNSNPLLRAPDTNLKAVVKTSNPSSIFNMESLSTPEISFLLYICLFLHSASPQQ